MNLARRPAWRLWALGVGLASIAGCATFRPASAPVPPRARNVVLMIGDGMADAAITIARNYHVGAAGRLHLDTLPHTGAATTYAVLEADPSLPDYVTDSAASATALATGRKTANYRVSTAPQTHALLPTILERARAAGRRTGVVTTASLADATPAAFVAHVNDRWCHGPEQMGACPRFVRAFGGPGSIVEQMVELGPEVLLGGGADAFGQTIGAGPGAGRRVRDWAADQGYRVIDDASALASVQPGTKVLGIFAPMEFTVGRGGVVTSLPPMPRAERCRELQRPATQPSLVELTDTALRLLAPQDAEAPGFFLMIEGALIDKRAHAADLCGQIGETVEFDAAVARVLAFAAQHPDTLVIVTGDHDHAPQIVATQFAGVSPGITATVLTADGAPMTVLYGTSGLGLKQQHTGTQLRVAATGPGAERVRGVLDQTEVHGLMEAALGLPPAPPTASGNR